MKITQKNRGLSLAGMFKHYHEKAKIVTLGLILYHILFWGTGLGLFFMLMLNGEHVQLDALAFYFLLYIGNIIFFYVLIFRKPTLNIRGLVVLLSLPFFWFILYNLSIGFIRVIFPKDETLSPIFEQFFFSPLEIYKTLFAQAIDSNFAVMLMPTSALTVYWLWKKQEQNKKLTEEELNLKLNLLRTKINPTLLFRTLDELEEVTADQPDAKESIQKLSSLMAYSINETGNEAVELKREIEFVEEYVALARMRLNEKKKINLEVLGNPVHLKIRPLILISFVENSIKHGLNKTNKNAWVDIKIVIEKSELFFICRNSTSAENKSTDFETSGIGLKNTQKRLSYYYPKKHELQISEVEKEYSVKLRIQLG